MRHFISLLLAFGTLGVACVHRAPDLKFGPEGPLTRSDEVLGRLESVEGSVVSLKGDSKLTIESPQTHGTVSMLVAVGAGGRLHLETLDFFGKPLGVLVSDGNRFGLYRTQENIYEMGPASDANVSRFLPIGLPPRELEDLLLGRVPRSHYANVGPVTVDKEEGAYKIELRSGGGTQTLWIDTETFRVKKSTLRGRPGYDLTFGETFVQDGKTFPRVISLRADSVQTAVTLRYGDVTLGGELEDALFEPRPPAGAVVKRVNEDGAEILPRPRP